MSSDSVMVVLMILTQQRTEIQCIYIGCRVDNEDTARQRTLGPVRSDTQLPLNYHVMRVAPNYVITFLHAFSCTRLQ